LRRPAFDAGSATRVAGRLMTGRQQAKWGQPVAIENRHGADGLLKPNNASMMDSC
jgi:tripartite-type tricarboxylate transporter receptor subunit TctC